MAILAAQANEHVRPMIHGVRTHVVDEGTGTPILFIHGNPDSADLWRGIIPALKQRHRCIAPDLPGFGRSVAPPDFDCSLENLAAFIEGVLDHLRVDQPVNLVVHDFGGPIGLTWALRHPDKVGSLVLINTVFHSDFRWHFWARVWRTPWLGELSMATMTLPVFMLEMRRGSRKLTREQIRHTYSLMSPPMRRMVLKLYRTTDVRRLATLEGRLFELTSKVPTCVLWGDHDPYIAKQYAERFGAWEIYHFSDCGHWLPLEAADAVSKRLLKFLA